MNWTTNSCELDGEKCACFQGEGNPEGVAYREGDEITEIIDGQKTPFQPCIAQSENRNMCVGCTQPGWVLYTPEPAINQCFPQVDNCHISFYQGCNFTGKVCHMSWMMDGTGNEEPGVESFTMPRGSLWHERNGFENLPSYDPKQCDWISSGIGSVRRPTKGEDGYNYRNPNSQGRVKFGNVPFHCWVRIRAAESIHEKFRVLYDDEEVKCFETSDHNLKGTPKFQDRRWSKGDNGGKQPNIDKELATNVYAVTKEFLRHC